MAQKLIPYKPRAYAVGKLTVELDGRKVLVDGEPLHDPLTAQEFKVLWSLLRASFKAEGREFTSREVWEMAWPHERNFVWTDTVKREVGNKVSKTVSNARTKLKPLEVIQDITYRIIGRVRDATSPEPLFLTLHRIFICTVGAVAVTVCVDSVARALLASMGATIAQSSQMGLSLGLLQGIVGTMFWSAGVALPLFGFWFLIDGFQPWKSRLAWLRGPAIGGLAGGAVGAFISYELLDGLFAQSRVNDGWLWHEKDPLSTAFTVTRMGYSEPWFGLLVGASLSVTILWIVSRPAWETLLLNGKKLTHVGEAWRVCRELVKLGAGWGLLFIFTTLLIGSWLFALWLPAPPADVATAYIPLKRVLGEGVCIAIGGMSFVVGTLMALYSMAKGVDVAGDVLCSMYRVPNAGLVPYSTPAVASSVQTPNAEQ